MNYIYQTIENGFNKSVFYKIIRYGSKYGYNVSHHEQGQGLVKISLGHFGDKVTIHHFERQSWGGPI